MHIKLPLYIQMHNRARWSKESHATTATSAVHTTALVLLLVVPQGAFMNRSVRTKKLVLHRESVRRLTREIGPRELARALGGGADGVDANVMHVPIVTRTWDEDPQ